MVHATHSGQVPKSTVVNARNIDGEIGRVPDITVVIIIGTWRARVFFDLINPANAVPIVVEIASYDSAIA